MPPCSAAPPETKESPNYLQPCSLTWASRAFTALCSAALARTFVRLGRLHRANGKDNGLLEGFPVGATLSRHSLNGLLHTG